MKASELRAKAWESLRGNYWNAVLVAFIAAIFGAAISGFGASFNLNISQEDLQFMFEEVPAIVTALLIPFAGLLGILSFVNFILGGVVQLGYAGFLLKQQDREIGSVKDLFSQFDRFGQGFLQSFLRGLYVFLWSLLFVIPGIIKLFSYAMTPFIMADNPNMTAKEAITASKQLMRGHKWELFCLSFSFIGWELLAILTLGIGEIFLAPYVEAAYAAFYRDKIAPKQVAFVAPEYVISE